METSNRKRKEELEGISLWATELDADDINESECLCGAKGYTKLGKGRK